jgi:hypothetical protein
MIYIFHFSDLLRRWLPFEEGFSIKWRQVNLEHV